MSTGWQEILDLGTREPAPVAEATGEDGESRGGAFRRLRESLSKSRRALTEEISASLFERLDDETWERLEEALILADAGRRPRRRWSSASSRRWTPGPSRPTARPSASG